MRKVSQCNQHSMKDGRYLPISTLGTGTYGQVIRCADTIAGAHVAIKIAHKEPAYRRSALNELRVLRLLCGTPEVLRITDSFEDEGRICIVGEILHKNMYEVLKDNSFAVMPLRHVASVGRSVLTALSALHAQGYMHCDIKPENVMLRGADDDFTNCCVIDFGAVRLLSENAYYDIQSLWYRAPEVICGLPYTPLIDSWSVGALLYELHTGSPLFPGDTPQEQLFSISETLGYPSDEAMTLGKNAPSLIFEMPLEGPKNPFEKVVVDNNSAVRDRFCDLLMCLMNPNEKCRMTCSEALRHPFFTAGSPSMDEIECMPDYEHGLSFEDRQSSERQSSDLNATIGHLTEQSSPWNSGYSPMFTPIKTPVKNHHGSATSASNSALSIYSADMPSPSLTSSSFRQEMIQDAPYREPPVQSWLLTVAQPPMPIGE
jgi:serine/threonine protein kinase